MNIRDDDDLKESLSSGRNWESTEKRQEKKEVQKHKEKLKKLQTQVQLQNLKGSQEKKTIEKGFGTKTREQEIQEQVQQADTNPQPDILVEDAKRQDAVDRQTQYEDEQQLP